MSLLNVHHLNKAFGGNHAVNDVSFSLQAGELLALIGPNGAGKSTTFNLVNGQLAPDNGSITLDGVSLLGRKPHELWRMGVSRTFQMAQTFGSLTVAENVQMALLSADGHSLSPWQRATHYRRADALQLLESVQLDTQAKRPCSELAYGDVKRLELAMALANEPRLLLMDEPTAGMAPDERRALMSLTRSLVNQRGVAVLFTEHSMDVVFEHADRVLVMARGALIAEGSPAKIQADPHVQAVYFGSGKALGTSEKLQGTSTTRIAPSHDTPLLDVHGLSAWYGAAQVVFDAKLQVQRGEVVALIGRNGAGKSSVLKAIMGLMPRSSGRVIFSGHDISQAKPYQAAQLRLGYVPEDRRIFTDLTVLENLQLAVNTKRNLAHLSANALTDADLSEHTPPSWSLEQIFALFPNLADMQQRPASHMSGGEQQMLTVARTLMGNPLMVLLDEPSEGVAPVIVEQMGEMILALKRQGVSVLLSEQNTHFAQWVSDRSYTLDRGVLSA
ncbi:ATP-binding cassette domain-containing protein [Limnohabitans sp.]|uniref:ATP-binding cassette domain-containing protein n=1 Tax=Limnohabitans sp. TaxID=1907725 RepID=UPI00286F815F|nr:ATP-binding cassette domain-containing protein [Limnohabitans sp.]